MELDRDNVMSEIPPPPRHSSIPPHLAAGMIIDDKYELVRKLGVGAMGEVWVARHCTLDEEVAIKLVMGDVDHEDGTSSESRFLLEARVAALLSRKTRHIVTVTDHGEEGAMSYLVMELLEGEPLETRVDKKGSLSLLEAVPIISQIARGLAVAHAEGIIHRDLKPSNVFLKVDEDGHEIVKILDFGIAKLKRRQRLATHATLRGFLLGTPPYMSPEQVQGREIDHRADVWALGVIAYHLLTGQYPFDGQTPSDLFAAICTSDMRPIQQLRPDLPEVVHDFFSRVFAPRLPARFQSAVSLAGAFEQLEPLAMRVVAGPSTAPPPQFVPASRPNASPDPGSTIVAAGLPSKRWWPALLAAICVVGVLAATFATITLYLEREPSKNSVSIVSRTAEPTSREVVPPPDLAVVAPPKSIPVAEVSAPSVVRPADLPPAPPPSVVVSSPASHTEPPPVVTPRGVDKSEIF